MSRELKHRLFRVSGAVVALALAALLPILADPRPSAPREIALVARNMAFYVEGDTTPNPTLRFKANERVRVTLKNADPGMTHNFAIEAWGVTTPHLRDEGPVSIEFHVPPRNARYEYICAPHAQTMRGIIEIE